MKVSQELSILFWLRKDNKNKEGKATIMVWITIDGHRDGFSLGYQVEPSRFDRKAAAIIGKSAEAIEINKHILHVKAELIRYYNLLKTHESIVTPPLLKNAYLSIHQEKKTLIQVIDFQISRLEEKVKADLRAPATLGRPAF